jgi:phosphate starvation-inducible membrane PsiE
MFYEFILQNQQNDFHDRNRFFIFKSITSAIYRILLHYFE